MSHWMQSVDRFAQAWSNDMSRAALGGGAALLLAWIICTIGTGIPPRGKCWAWRIAYLKLLIALVWVTPIELPVLRRAAAIPRTAPIVQGDGIISDIATATPVLPEVTAVRPSVASVPRPHWGIVVLMLGWSIGCGAMLLRITFKVAAAARLRRSCIPIDNERMHEECQRMCRGLRIASPPALLISNRIHSPLLIGAFHPAIVLPQAMQFLPPGEINIILAHELAHLRRRDLLWGFFAAVVESLFFFHPLVWLSRVESRLAQEMAADQMALQQTAVAPADYGRLLLHVAARAAQPPILSAAMISSRKTLERRFTAMKRMSLWSGRKFAVASAALILAAPLTLPSWRLVARAADGQATSRTTASPQTAERAETRVAAADGNGEEEKFVTTITFADKAPLVARTDGFLKSVNVKQGDLVKKGTTVFILDDARARLAAHAAQLTLEQKELELTRKSELHDKKVAGDLEVQEAKYDVALAQDRLKLAMQDVEDHAIKSPIDGVVEFTSTPQIGGAWVKGGGGGVVISKSQARAEFQVPQSLRPRIRNGMPVEVTVKAYPGEVLRGTVAFIHQRNDQLTGTASVVADLSNPKQLDLEGMIGELRIAVPTDPAGAH